MSTIVLVLPVSQVTVDQGRAVTTATVTNQGTAPESVVVGVFPPPAGVASASAVGWTTVEEPQRTIQPGATEQFTVTFVPPAGAGAGTYVARFIAYSATGAPEESADQARQVDVVISAPVAAAPVKKSSWWIYAVAAALVLIVGVVAFLVLRPTPDPCANGACTPSPTPTTATPTPPVVVENITWTLKSIRQSDMVIPISAKITLRVEGDKVFGFAGCNNYSGTWQRDGNNVQITNVLSSLVLCFPQQVAQQSSIFKSVLSQVTTLESDGSTTLSLRTSDDQEMRFIRP